MANYNNSKIYKIEPIVEHEPYEIYIGSTTKERLCQRMAHHRGDYKAYQNEKRGKITAFDLFEKYGIDNCQIILIEECKCNSKDELMSREAHYIKSLECINKYIPGRNYKERRKEEKYKVKHNEYKKEKLICECGCTIRRDGMKEHRQTKKHIDLIKEKEEN